MLVSRSVRHGHRRVCRARAGQRRVWQRCPTAGHRRPGRHPGPALRHRRKHDQYIGDEFKDEAGMLARMKGTTPLAPLSEDFKARIKALRPELTDYTYAGETYDAIVISALAAQQAGSIEPTEIANQINSVTTGGTECQTDHVAVDNDFPQLVDDILQLLPETRDVFMVMGAGPNGKFWRQQLEAESSRFRGRVTFIWSDGAVARGDPAPLREPAGPLGDLRHNLRHGRQRRGVSGRACARRPSRHSECSAVWNTERVRSVMELSAAR